MDTIADAALSRCLGKVVVMLTIFCLAGSEKSGEANDTHSFLVAPPLAAPPSPLPAQAGTVENARWGALPRPPFGHGVNL